MKHNLLEYYRFPDDSLGSVASVNHTGEAGFFRFGPEEIYYGHCETGPTAKTAAAALYDASNSAHLRKREIRLPFDAPEVIDNLRSERYAADSTSGQNGLVRHALTRKAYYLVRELLPVSVRRYFQRAYFRGWRELPFPHWPVDFTVDTLHEKLLQLSMKSEDVQRIPFIWFWPRAAQSCLIMTHDVETTAGRDFTPQLMDLDDSFGIKSSFQVVPEKRYEVPDDYVQEIRSRGFEFNIHDLNHDGFLFREHEEFLRRAAKINEYAHKYQARGFRAGAMYRKQAWYDAFEFSYDMSVPNVAHLEPQRGGCCTAMPYFVGKLVELPLTATQDYTLFNILNDYSLDLWKRQIALIDKRHGLISFIAHPDYLIEQRARKTYTALLDYLREMVSQRNIWAALPGEVDCWWRARSQMKLVRRGGAWEIEGAGKENATIAYANLTSDDITYDVERDSERNTEISTKT